MLKWGALLLLLMLTTQQGCVGQQGLQPPDGWEAQAIPSRQASDPTGQPRLQVVICYSKLISSHACLRLEGGNNQMLLWDPGGSYGEDMPGYHRQGDVLLDRHALTLDQLWIYRQSGCGEPYMLVFEWQLTPEQARRCRQLFEQSLQQGDSGDGFHTDAPGGGCSVYVSRFLTKHCPVLQGLSGNWFWPHNLAQTLWQRQPGCVLLYQRGQPVMRYRPTVHVAKGEQG